MTLLKAQLHFDSAVGLTTADFSTNVIVKQQLVEIVPIGFPFKLCGALAFSHGNPLFFTLADNHSFTGIVGTSIYAFNKGTFTFFEAGELSSIELYPFGRGVLEYV